MLPHFRLSPSVEQSCAMVPDVSAVGSMTDPASQANTGRAPPPALKRVDFAKHYQLHRIRIRDMM